MNSGPPAYWAAYCCVALLLSAAMLAPADGAGASKVYGTAQVPGQAGVGPRLPKACVQAAGLVQRCHDQERNWFVAMGLKTSACAEADQNLVNCVQLYPEEADPTGELAGRGHGSDWERSAVESPPPRRSRADGLTAKEFHEKYISTGQPVIVTDAADSWRAMDWCDARQESSVCWATGDKMACRPQGLSRIYQGHVQAWPAIPLEHGA